MTYRTIDFSNVEDNFQKPSGLTTNYVKTKRPLSADGKVLTQKQIRARMRRKAKRGELATPQEIEHLYNKPIEEWDLAELAAGRPKNSKGHFRGPKPTWITAQVHEEAMEKYKAAIKTDMRMATVDAVGFIKEMINDDSVDEKGKPLVPASTKLDAAKFLLEHVVGKPTQTIQGDVSIKLQAILGNVMVNPMEQPTGELRYEPAHYPGVTMELAQAADYEVDDDDADFE